MGIFYVIIKGRFVKMGGVVGFSFVVYVIIIIRVSVTAGFGFVYMLGVSGRRCYLFGISLGIVGRVREN